MQQSERELLDIGGSSDTRYRVGQFGPHTFLKLARLALSALVVGCFDDCSSSGPILGNISLYPSSSSAPPPTVTKVFVTPADVLVEGGNPASFKLRVLAEYSDGALHEPRDGAVLWSLPTPPTGTSVTGDGMLGSVEITKAFTADFEVKATVGGVSSVATVRATTMSPAADAVVSQDHPGQLPTVALADGWLSPTQCAGAIGQDEPVAFVRQAPLASLQPMQSPMTASDCRVDGALFSPTTAIWRTPMGWTPSQDVLHAISGVPITDAAPIRPKIRLIIGVTGGFCTPGKCTVADVIWGAKELARLGGALANDIFVQSRAGIQLDPLVAAPSDVVPLPGLDGCAKVLALPPPVAPKPNELTVYMVDELANTDYAVTCHEYNDPPLGIDSDKKVIIIGYRYAVYISTLAHELGHAFGLRKPQHVNVDMTGFGDYNLMSVITDPKIDRFHLTLGQIYRMTVDTRSWLNTSNTRVGTTVACQCELGDSKPCPKLSRDVKPLEKAAAWTPSSASTCP